MRAQAGRDDGDRLDGGIARGEVFDRAVQMIGVVDAPAKDYLRVKRDAALGEHIDLPRISGALRPSIFSA